MDHYALAACLACLLMGIPLTLAAWAFVDTKRSSPNQSNHGVERSEHAGLASSRQLILASRIYFGMLAGGVAWVAISLLRADVETSHWAKALLLYVLASGFLALAPWRPVMGPLAYIVASYMLPRQDPVIEALMDTVAVSLLTVLSVAALAVWFLRTGRRPAPPRTITVWSLMLFSFWVGVVVFAAMWNGHPISEDVVHRTGRICQSLALFLVAYYCRPGLADFQMLIAAVTVMLGLRAGRFTSGLSLEQNLAALAAITVPWAVALAFSCKRWWTRAGSFLLALGLMGLVFVIANRGAFLGLGGAMLATWIIARWKWRIAVACAPALLLAALVLPRFGLGQRLDQAHEGGAFQESAAARLELWTVGLDIAARHPLFGVGPENYAHYLQQHFAPHPINSSAHNIFVDVVAEMGYPGLVLFAAIWCCATVSLVHAIIRPGRPPTQGFLVAALASLWAYLVVGSFLSLHSLVFIYILLGLALGAAALARQCSAAEAASAPIRTRGSALRPVLTRSDFDLAALVYGILVVLGSLAPFHLQSLGLAVAARSFLALQWWPPDFTSRVDTVSNVALFVPLGFLFMGSLSCDARTPSRRIVSAFLVLVGCGGFGAAVEYLQLWFPERTASANDVIAQLLGAGIGLAFWIAVGQRLVDGWRVWRADRAHLPPAGTGILLYALSLMIWYAWPLELSLHPRELLHKYRDGYLNIFALADYAGPPSSAAWSVFVDLLLTLPLGWLFSTAWLKLHQRRRALGAVLALALATAVGIEALRLMSYGQPVSVDQGLITLAGVLLGALVHRTAIKSLGQGDGVPSATASLRG